LRSGTMKRPASAGSPPTRSPGRAGAADPAIALAAQPRLLLLDEPASGMNPAEKTTVMGLIQRIREQGVTILLVEHDMRLVMGISHQIIVLHHGRVIAQGPPGEIQSHPEVIRAYLGGG